MNNRPVFKWKADILIVDDTPENLDVLIQMLKNPHYNIRPATNGKTALQSASNKLPDLMLIDIHMPDMDGYTLCGIIKKDDKLKNVPVIFISAHTDPDEIRKAYSAGGADYLIKPFNLEEVLTRIETHLKIHFLELELEECKKKLAKYE